MEKHILCRIYKCYSICLFFIHSLNKAFYFQEIRMYPNYSIPLLQSRLSDVSCKALSGMPIIKQSILTSDIDKLSCRVCLHMEAYGTSKKWGLVITWWLFPTGVGNKHSVFIFYLDFYFLLLYLFFIM